MRKTTRQDRAPAETAEVGRAGKAGKGNAAYQRYASVPAPIQAKGDLRAPGAHEVAAEGLKGSGVELPHVETIQASFGKHDVSGVKAHVGADANAACQSLGAAAYASAGATAFKSAPDLHTAAHEAAHVVQQRAHVHLKDDNLGRAGDSYEQHADQVADAVVKGASAEPLLDQVASPTAAAAGPSNAVQRKVDTYGGEFDTTTYAAQNSGAGVGKLVGGKIVLEFKANDLVEADNIGMVQTVKTLRSTKVGGTVDDPSYVQGTYGGNKAVSTTKAEGDEGRAIDQIDAVGGNKNSTLPQTSPLYAVGNAQKAHPTKAGKTVDTVATTLTDVKPDPANDWGQHGNHKRKPDGTFENPVPAILKDTPGRTLQFVGQQWEHSFEATALILDGPMANTYLGSVKWGWKADATGVAKMDPDPITLISMGTPSADFMASAKKWNDATFTDKTTGKTYDSVDLPLTKVRTVDPSTLSDRKLLERIREIADKLMTADKHKPDYQNLRFESRGLAKEAAKRGGGAEDSGEVYKVKSGDSLWKIAKKKLGSGLKWTKIFSLNVVNVLDPNLIKVGQELKLPKP